MSEIMVYIVSGIASIISGAILYFLRKYFQTIERHACEAEERRATKDLLVLKSLKALGELTVANAVAVRDGHTNGEMSKAMDEFNAVDKELHEFLMKSATKSTSNKR